MSVSVVEKGGVSPHFVDTPLDPCTFVELFDWKKDNLLVFAITVPASVLVMYPVSVGCNYSWLM